MCELSTFTGYLASKAGRLVPLAAALFILAKHVDIEKPKERSTETQEPVEPLESAIECT